MFFGRKRIAELENEIEGLKAENLTLKRDIHFLEKENDELKKKCGFKIEKRKRGLGRRCDCSPPYQARLLTS